MKLFIWIVTLGVILSLVVGFFWPSESSIQKHPAPQNEKTLGVSPSNASSMPTIADDKPKERTARQTATPQAALSTPAPITAVATQLQSIETEDPFLQSVHNLVDGAAIIHEKMQQIPGAVIPELTLLEPVDWVRLSERFPDLIDPQKALEAVAETRVQAKDKFLSAVSYAHGMASFQNNGEDVLDLKSLKNHSSVPIPDAVWERYEIPDKTDWASLAETWVPSGKYGPPRLIVREKQTDWAGPDARAMIIFFEAHQAEINGVNVRPPRKLAIP